MDSTPVGAGALKVASERSQRQLQLKTDEKLKPKVKKMKVLEEEEFVEKVEKIIERDYFPYLDAVRRQTNYLDALDSQDTVRISEAEKQLKEATPASMHDTPSKVNWDDDDWSANTPGTSLSKAPIPVNPAEKLRKEIAGVSLTKFMSNNTSEDNDSFKEVMLKAEIARRKKLDWVYKPETLQSDKALMPPPAAPLLSITDGAPRTLDGWSFKVHNSVMYNPEGAPLTAAEQHQLRESQPKISQGATRLGARLWKRPESAGTVEDKRVLQKVGIDGKEGWDAATPRVNGFAYVATPSPKPGVAESPLMTWGEVESTPFLIDHISEGSKFRMNEPSAREKLALSLAEKSSAKKRDAQKSARKASATPEHFSARSPCLSGLSPAAKKLALGKLGIRRGVDKGLMSTYTPSRRDKLAIPSPFPTPSSVVTPEIRERTKASDFF